MKNNFITRFNNIITEIKNLKMNQTFGGDSWVVYRSEVNATINSDRVYRIVFSPETSNLYVAVCKVTSPDRSSYGTIRDLYPDPNRPGIWYKPTLNGGNFNSAVTFFVYSTVKGKVSVHDVTGLDIGVML